MIINAELIEEIILLRERNRKNYIVEYDNREFAKVISILWYTLDSKIVKSYYEHNQYPIMSYDDTMPLVYQIQQPILPDRSWIDKILDLEGL